MTTAILQQGISELDPATWDAIKKFWNYPKLKDPIILTDKDLAQKVMGESIAFIRMDTHEIYVNMPKLEEKVGKQHLDMIIAHEIGHHKLIPYDLRIALNLMNNTLKVIRNEEQAAYVQNLFADIIVNTKIFQVDQKIADTYNEMQKRSGGETNDVWDLYMRIYEKLWKLPDKTYVQNCSQEVDEDASHLSKMLSKQMFRAKTWQPKIQTFARVFKKYMEKVHPSNMPNNQGQGQQSQSRGSSQGQKPQQSGGSSGQGKKKQKKGGGQGKKKQGGAGNKKDDKNSPTPDGILIDKHEPKDFGDIEKGLKDIAGDLNRDDFKRLAEGVGGANNPQHANRMYYSALADNYSLEMPEDMEKGTSYFRARDRLWVPSRGVSNLDLKRTIMKGGRPIVAHNTLEGVTEGASQLQGSGKKKDLIVIIDTSSSMANPIRCMSYATLSGMVAAHSAHNQECQVAIINFSDSCIVTPFTYNLDEIDKALLCFQGNGTNLPTHELMTLVDSNQNDQHILLITDADTYNINSAKSYFSRAFDKTKSGTVFLVNPYGSDAQIFEGIGYKIQSMTGEDDMLEATLNDMQEVYN